MTGERVLCTTEEQAERLRKAGYHVTVRPPHPSAPRRTAAKWEPSPHLVASVLGPALGKQFQRDGFALARHLKLPIEFVPIDSLQNPSRPITTIVGRLLKLPKQTPVIQLACGLAGQLMNETLVHEIAHHVLRGGADEVDCNCFARYFLQTALPETPAARWRRWQNEANEKVREQARRRAGAVLT